MFARLLAAFCLFNPAVVLCQSGSELVVHLRADGAVSAATVEHMKRELGMLLQGSSYRLEWPNSRVETSGMLVVLEIRGSADGSKALASTSVNRDGVLPFIVLNSGNLSRLVGSALAGEPAARRDFLFGRAMARVLAHELYHVLANTREHATSGVGKPQFTASDLLGERFDFEAVTVARMETPASASSEAPSGR